MKVSIWTDHSKDTQSPSDAFPMAWYHSCVTDRYKVFSDTLEEVIEVRELVAFSRQQVDWFRCSACVIIFESLESFQLPSFLSSLWPAMCYKG